MLAAGGKKGLLLFFFTSIPPPPNTRQTFLIGRSQKRLLPAEKEGGGRIEARGSSPGIAGHLPRYHTPTYPHTHTPYLPITSHPTRGQFLLLLYYQHGPFLWHLEKLTFLLSYLLDAVVAVDVVAAAAVVVVVIVPPPSPPPLFDPNVWPRPLFGGRGHLDLGFCVRVSNVWFVCLSDLCLFFP